MKAHEHTFKIVLFGDGGVGKTSLAQRFLTGIFSGQSGVTIGVEFYVKTLVVGSTRVKLRIWDFGGEERFRFLLPRYCQGADGGLFIYDMTAPATLQQLQNWLQVILENAPDLPVLVVGSKVDLADRRKVAREEAAHLAKALNLAGFAEVSAKTGYNVEEVFEAITKIMIRKEGGGNPP